MVPRMDREPALATEVIDGEAALSATSVAAQFEGRVVLWCCLGDGVGKLVLRRVLTNGSKVRFWVV